MLDNPTIIGLGAGAIGGVCTIIGSYLVIRNGSRKHIETTIDGAVKDIVKLQAEGKKPCEWHQQAFKDVYVRVEEKVKESNENAEKLEREFDEKTEKFSMKADKLSDAISSLDKTVAVLNQSLVNQQVMCEHRGRELFEIHKRIGKLEKEQ